MFEKPDEQLAMALAELREADKKHEPSRELEDRVMAAWDLRGERTPPRPTASHVRIGLAVAAAAVVLALAGLVLRQPGSPATRAADVITRASDVTSGATSAAVSEDVSPVMSTGNVRPDAEGQLLFVPLSPDAYDVLSGSSGSVQLARVRVPREVLSDLGVVVDAYRIGEPVQADVLFGEDGLARAIRLVPASRRF